MSIDLGRRLIAAGLVPPEEVEAALFVSVARGVPFARVLIDRGAINERGLERELERLGGLGLRQVAGAAELVARLPRAMCRRLAALPTKYDPQTGTIDVAAADPLDPHVASEFGFHLGASIRVVRAPIAAIEEAIRRLELDEPEPAGRARERRKTPPFPHGAPQSSLPPPVLDEAPIPLVRKAQVPPPPSPRETLPAQAPAPGIRRAPAAPFTMGAANSGPESPHRATIRPQILPHDAPAPTPLDTQAITRDTPPIGREAVPPAAPHGGARSGDPPAVSFPSMPPESSGGVRTTPPYGTPALAPPGAPIDLGPRPRAEAQRAPLMNAEPGGRLATLPPEPIAGRTLRPAATIAVDAAGPPPIEDTPVTEEPRRVIRAVDSAPVRAALDRATSRDDVIREAMKGMRLVARRIGVFAVKRDGFHGWSCNVDLGDPDAFRELCVPIDQPSILATATATAMYLGRIPATPAHEGLLTFMERCSTDVAAVAARVAGRPALVLLADELDDTLTGTRLLGELAAAVGEALSRVLAGR